MTDDANSNNLNDLKSSLDSQESISDEISEMEKLYQTLNKFISMINSKNLTGDSKTVKYITNFLRVNILTYLRENSKPSNIEIQPAVNDAMMQWWVTLLNFLNSDTGSSTNIVQGLLMDIDVISVSLECISKIMTMLMVLPKNAHSNIEIYLHHILITIHYVTNRLIINSKLLRDQADFPADGNMVKFHNKYNSILRSFLGKLNAYAFFYLPDSFNYDTQILLELNFKIQEEPHETLFFWKQKKFSSSQDDDKAISCNSIESKDSRFFKIIISHLKNDFTFLAFYWHYWHILITYASKLENGDSLIKTLDLLPGSSILVEYVTKSFLSTDLYNLKNYISSSVRNSKSFNDMRQNMLDATENMPDIGSIISEQARKGRGGGKSELLSDEQLNNFIFCKFKSIKVWECLRSLAGCFKEYSIPVLSLHDSKQLEFITSFSAYDFRSGNIIYNKLLQFIIFQFSTLDSLKFLDWNTWCSGILMMLRTSNINCQITGLLCLFNIWNYLPNSNRRELSSILVTEFWSSFTSESDFHISKLLYMRLIVFKVLQSGYSKTNIMIKHNLEKMSKELSFISAENSHFKMLKDKNVLDFYGNKRFMTFPNKQIIEHSIISKMQSIIKTEAKEPIIIFPFVSSTISIRPTYVLRGGKFPYDVLDELTSRAEIVNYKKPMNSKDSQSFDTSEKSEDDKNHTLSYSISSTINSWFSKVSSSTDSRSSSINEGTNHRGKIAPPSELDFSRDITRSNRIPLVLKAVTVNNDHMLKRVDDANRQWGVVTARTYDKPLPAPVLSEVDVLVKEIHSTGLGSSTMDDFDIILNSGIDKTMNKASLSYRPESLISEIPALDLSMFDRWSDKLHYSDVDKAESTGSPSLYPKDRILNNSVDPISLFGDDDTTRYDARLDNLEKNREFYKKTKFEKLANSIYIFNDMVGQYYDSTKLVDNELVFMEFEVRDNNNNSQFDLNMVKR